MNLSPPQGLYHADQRFGPGVVRYPDGREDVGLWLGERLLKLCTSVEEGFSLKNFPEYAAYMDPAATTESLTQVHADCLTNRWLPGYNIFISIHIFGLNWLKMITSYCFFKAPLIYFSHSCILSSELDNTV